MDRARLKSWKRFFRRKKHHDQTGGEQELEQELDLPPFIYGKLPAGTIRLLTPEPITNSRGQPTEYAWRMQIASLSDKEIQFDALSYVWGSQNETFLISLDGKFLRVHHNLYAALPYLVNRGKQGTCMRPIWIDAICINQEDEEEKSEQIASMHRIYRHAEKVWVWLGLSENQDRIPEAIELLPSIRLAGIEADQDTSIPEDQIADVFGLSDLEPALWDATFHILMNPWYRRVWVMQEVALARDWSFLCGEHEIRTDVIEEALVGSYLLNIRDSLGNLVDLLSSTDSEAVYTIRNRVQHDLTKHASSSTDAAMVLAVSIEIANNNLQCLLPADRIRGVLGLCQTPALVELELHEITDIGILYTTFSKYLFMEAGTEADLQWWFWFSHACYPIRDQGLPSWVPDLHHQGSEYKCRPFPLLIDHGYRVSRPFRASAKQRSVGPGERLNELSIRGKLLDEVVIAHDEMPFPSGRGVPLWLQHLNIIADWEENLAASIAGVLEQHQGSDPTKEPQRQSLSMEEYWATLIGDIIDMTGAPMPGGAYGEFRATLDEAKEAAAKYLMPGEPYAALQDRNIDNSYAIVERFRALKLYEHTGILGDRQLFWTKENRYGFTNQGVQPGDVICIFDGAVVPYVLRRVDDQVGRWRLFGEAVIPGLMYEEADAMEIEERDFILV